MPGLFPSPLKDARNAAFLQKTGGVLVSKTPESETNNKCQMQKCNNATMQRAETAHFLHQKNRNVNMKLSRLVYLRS